MARVELTKSQREFIYARSEFVNGARVSEWTQEPHDKLEIHHWRPVSYQVLIHNECPEEYNSPYRLILLTTPEHHKVHPDIIPAIRDYWRDKKSFEKVFRKRRVLMERGQKYWVTSWDGDFQRIARHNTLTFIKAGNHYPERTRWV
jgi:hypothetical protein